MSLMQIVSGAYGLYYKARGTSQFLSIGHTDKDGVFLRIQKHSQQIQTALTGDTICDLLQTGASLTLHMNCIEAGNTILRRMMFDNTTDAAGGSPDEGLLHSITKPMGRLASSFGGEFKALPLQGTSAASYQEGGSGFHFSIVTLDNQSDIELRLNSYARIIPLVFRALPYVTGTSTNAQIRSFKWVNEFANLADFNFAAGV